MIPKSESMEISMKKHRKVGFAVIFGVVISFCYAAGYLLEAYDSLNLADTGFYLRWFVEAVFITGILYAIWELADRCMNKIMSSAIVKKVKFKIPYWCCVLILFLCWLPAWLSIFPGAFSYDALSEWEQVRNNMITSHHPVIHVLWVGGLLEGFHSVTGSYNWGIAVYTFMQMIILANVLTCTLRFLKEFQVPDIFCWITLLFYGLSPVIQLFSISTTKDVLFTAAQLMFLMNLVRLYCRREQFFQSRKRMVSFGVSAFATMILRNNGFYIVLFTLIIVLAGCKKYRKKFLAVLVGISIVYGVYTGPVYSMLHVTSGGIEEMLSVPLQQMARVYKYDYDSLEAQDVELLCQVIPEEYLERYRPTVSDFVKKGFQKEEFQAHKTEFLKLWCKWGIEHPLTYINSFLINTVDFWYPGAVVDGYRDAYGKSSYFDYQVDEPGEVIVLLPRVHNYYETISCDCKAQKAPLAFLVLSPGWYLVVTAVILGYLWRCGKKEFRIVSWMLILTMLTVLFGPMALVRYVLILYYAFPVLLSFFFASESFIKSENIKSFAEVKA